MRLAGLFVVIWHVKISFVGINKQIDSVEVLSVLSQLPCKEVKCRTSLATFDHVFSGGPQALHCITRTACT